MSVIDLAAAKRMPEAEYRLKRAEIRATYGDTATQRTAAFDQSLAVFFYRSGWTQEQLAHEEGKSQSYIARRLLFGRFVADMPIGINPKTLTEGHFRSYWERTDTSERNERIRFREVAQLMAEQPPRSPRQNRAIADAIKTTSGDGAWHRLSTITTQVQALVTAATEEDIEAVLSSMVKSGTHNVYAEKKSGIDQYRILIGGRNKIDLVTLKQELQPILDALKAEGRKNMATMSPGTVAHLAWKLECLIDRLAHLVPESSGPDLED